MESIKHIGRLEKKLAAFIKHAESEQLNVGFINGAKYPPSEENPDGEYVATVAFKNEFGTKEIPSRPFFRSMIAKEKSTWGDKLTRGIHYTKYDFKAAMKFLGEDVEGALRQSIIHTNEPPNSAETIARKGFNKPLIDTSLMMDSIRSEVVKP